MEISKILIVCAAIILGIAVALSLLSPKQHHPEQNACEALRPQLDWDHPAYRLLCTQNGGRRE